jgi:hypothetical protein
MARGWFTEHTTKYEEGMMEDARVAEKFDTLPIVGYVVGSTDLSKKAQRNKRARENRAARDDVMRSLGLTKCRVNGRTFWE